MKLTKKMMLSLCFGFLASASCAEEGPAWSLGAGLSTMGANVEAQYRLTPRIGLRGVVSGGINRDFDVSDTDFDISGNIKMGATSLLLDAYPLGGSWRISAGLLKSGMEFNAAGTVDVSGVQETADVTARFSKSTAPIVTTSYDVRLGKSLAITPEIGVIFNGGIDLAFEATGTTLQSTIDNDPDVQDAIQTAADINKLPYIALTISYRF